MASWIFQGHPKRWDLDRFFRDVAEGRVGPFTVWRAEQFADDLKLHDRVFFWRAGAGERPRIVAVGQVLGSARSLPDTNDDYRLPGHEDEFQGYKTRVEVGIESVLDTPFTEDELRLEPALANLSILNRVRRGITQFPVRPAESDRLLTLCEKHGATVKRSR
jgi:predicted RNA-binding protein with PUA-like domain